MIKYCNVADMPWPTNLVPQNVRTSLFTTEPNKCHIIIILVVLSLKMKIVMKK